MNKIKTLQIFIVLFLLLFSCFPVQATGPVIINNDVTIGERVGMYDGTDLIVDGCVVTMDRFHSFNNLAISGTVHASIELLDNSADSVLITNVTAYGWPNGRRSDHEPSYAVDGRLDTYTWTTEMYNTSAASLGLDFGAVTAVNRIRLWKDPDAGNLAHTPMAKNLIIQYTTCGGSMSSRTWCNVAGLTNGYQGKELMHASSIDSDGYVWIDIHDSVNSGHGWASLSFDPVQATGIRIMFDKTWGTEYQYIHYKVYEMQVYAPEPSSLPPVSTSVLSLNKQMIGHFESPCGVQYWQFTGVKGQQIRLQNVNISAPGIVFDLTGPNGWIGFTALSSQSELFTLPESGNYMLIARGAGGPNKSYYSFRLQETTVTDLPLNTVFDGEFIGDSQAQLFKVVLEQGSPFIVTLDDAADDNVNELYAKFGMPPTRGDYDYRFANMASADQDILIPMAYAGTWCILVYGNTIRTPGPYSLIAETIDLAIGSVTPDHHGNAFDAVLTIHGVGFDAGTDVALVAADSTAYPAASVAVDSFTQLTAVFAAQSVPAGEYDLFLFKPNGSIAQLAGAFEVIDGGETNLKTNLILPSSLGYHATATLYVEYSNTGDVTMPAPLISLSATQNGRKGAILTLDAFRLVQGFWTATMPEGFSNSVQFLASGQIPGMLQPGESVSVPVYYAGWLKPWDFGYPPIYFNLGIVTADDTESVDWDSLKDGMRPKSLTPEQWESVFDNFVTQVGNTWGNYVKMLDDNSFYLHQLGEYITDINKLLSFEIMQASGMTVNRTLASAIDAHVQTPGLPLTFTRSFSTDIPQHFRFGRFGWGWSDNWEWELSVAYDIPGQRSQPGTVTISVPGGSRRIFQPDSRPGRPYIAQPGDNATLTALGGRVYTLQESDGTIYCFRTDGKLDYVEDTHGNRITCIYEGGFLSCLQHSAGPFLSIDYMPSGCVGAISDSLGRTTFFTYDASGQHLASATDYRGLVYSYDYCIGEGLAREHALNEVVNPDGNHTIFTYNDTGRLQSRSGGCSGGCTTTYTYGSAGEVTATDALGNNTEYFFDHRGHLPRIRDPLGNINTRTYDSLSQLIKLTDAAGQAKTFAYDAHGNMIAETDALGYTTRYEYNGPFNRLSKVVDGNDNVTAYDYEPDGDLKSITDAAGNAENWTYDNYGNHLTWRNRRGQTIRYTNDELGRVREKLYPDGAVVTFAYDDRGNLTQYTDTTGTTTQKFDTADRLTKITYPGGQWLAYTYDAANRRASMVDQLGHRSDYHYDTEGRLESLTGEDGQEIVRYTYDAAGQMTLKTLDNRVYTTYAYDPAGQITELSNLKPDGSILSRFTYTYDRRGRRTTTTTTYGYNDPRTNLAGTWRYDYDDTGQLIGWTAPDGRYVEYTYDNLGNRLNVQDDNVNTAYVVNNLNQYTQVGNVDYQYDADGNLTKKIAPEGTTIYTWTPDNRLSSISGPGIFWQNSYDALGNRTLVRDNGAALNFVIDTIGPGNMVGEYHQDTGMLVAAYKYGGGLLIREDASAKSEFYTFDTLGNTSELTDESRTTSNMYLHAPYGTVLYQSGNALNPFQFAGQWGITLEGHGLHSIRVRDYSAELGRFIQSDPIGIFGSLPNPYTYTWNDPLNRVDTTGKGLVIQFFDVWRWFFSQKHNGAHNRAQLRKRLLDAEGARRFAEGFFAANEKDLYEMFRDAVIDRHTYDTWTSEKIFERLLKLLEEDSGFLEMLDQLLEIVAPFPNLREFLENWSWATGPRDPNRKLGPRGSGTAHFVIADSLLPYTIEFENDANATAPAQIVTITDQLDENLDWATFELTEIAFGDTFISVPAGSQHFETTVPMSFGGINFEVQIEAGIRLATGEVYANFYSIDDPLTCLPPMVDIGFLPPEDGTGRGQGHFSYIIWPNDDLPTGTEIRNIAYITFEGAETIATNQVDPHDPSKGFDPELECLNTFDGSKPQSQVLSLEPVQSSREFEVKWTGTDEGAGIKDYTIYVSQDDGPFWTWITNTDSTSAIFSGEDGKSYAFYSVARDHTGNREDPPSTHDTATRIESTRSLRISVIGEGTITEPGVGSYDYFYGQQVPVTAIADPNFKFCRWEGTAADSNAVIEYQNDTESKIWVTIDSDNVLTAVFDEVIHNIPLDSDPGWPMNGEWEFGIPTGQNCNSIGNPDPNSGHTGPYVIGVNLDGCYNLDTGPLYDVVAGPFNLSDYRNVKLRFWRWLNTDFPEYIEHRIEMSLDGNTWSPVWIQSPHKEITDSRWTLCEYPISGADCQPTVYLRWTYQVRRRGIYAYTGWNIDDIQLIGYRDESQ